MLPPILAAMEMVSNSTVIMPGMGFTYEVHNTHCDGGGAVKDVATLKRPPALILGPGCSSGSITHCTITVQ